MREAALSSGSVVYQCWTNLDAQFSRPYEAGDRLVKGWTGELEPEAAGDIKAMAETVFARHNRDDRPDAHLCPSMSVGDVVIFGEAALSVDAVGFVAVRVDRADLIVDRSWGDAHAEPRPSTAREITNTWSQTVQPSATPVHDLGLDR